MFGSLNVSIAALRATRFSLHSATTESAFVDVSSDTCVQGWRRQRRNTGRDWESAFTQVVEHETNLGFKYDYIVKLRTDEAICNSMPHYEKLHINNIMVPVHGGLQMARRGKISADYVGPVSDHFAVVPRKLASVYFRPHHELPPFAPCYNATDYSPCHGHKENGDVPPECLFGKHLARNGVSVDHGLLLGEESGCLFDAAGKYNRRPCRCPPPTDAGADAHRQRT
mmetsp:Transcript_76083/g.217210  ORF Transcript_76083/g.217210 Transcript_76083/m.217210 type:complete len:226 (+) Transcript_76083:573-1250(+)